MQITSLVQSARLNGHEPWAYPEGRPRAPARASEPPDRRAAAASLDASGLTTRPGQPGPPTSMRDAKPLTDD